MPPVRTSQLGPRIHRARGPAFPARPGLLRETTPHGWRLVFSAREQLGVRACGRPRLADRHRAPWSVRRWEATKHLRWVECGWDCGRRGQTDGTSPQASAGASQTNETARRGQSQKLDQTKESDELVLQGHPQSLKEPYRLLKPGMRGQLQGSGTPLLLLEPARQHLSLMSGRLHLPPQLGGAGQLAAPAAGACHLAPPAGAWCTASDAGATWVAPGADAG